MNAYSKETVCAASALKGETLITASVEEKAMVLDRLIMALNHNVRINATSWEMFDSILNSIHPEEKPFFIAKKERYRGKTQAYAYVRDMILCFLKFASEGIDTGKNEEAVREICKLIPETEKNAEELKMALEWYRSAFLPCELHS